MSSKLGKRICIIGPSSVGKSTLAYNLSNKLGIDAIYLDQVAHFDDSDWVRKPKADLVKVHNDLIKKENWIIEGNYFSLFNERFSRADTVIFIYPNRLKSLYNFIKRSLQKDKKRHGTISGSKERIYWSMIKYILYSGPKKYKNYDHIMSKYFHLNIIRLKSFKDINGFINSLN